MADDMAENKICDIIIPVFNQTALTRDCLKSIAANTDTPCRIILIDNASGDETKKFLESLAASHETMTLIRNETNLGWVKAVNQGLKVSTSPYLCIMNNDTVVKTHGWLSAMVDIAETADDIGLVNPCFEIKATVANNEPWIEIDFCRGYCILIKRAVIDRIGGLDEAYGLGYYDDDDFSVRAIRAGFRCVRANGVMVEHLKDSTFSAIFKDDKRLELHEKNKQLFYDKWGRRLKIVFVMTGASGRDAVKDVLLALARRQHIIYLWNLTEPLRIRHTNVREKHLPGLFAMPLVRLELYLNLLKKDTKHYDLILSDDGNMVSKLSSIRASVHYVDADSGISSLSGIVNSAAGLH